MTSLVALVLEVMTILPCYLRTVILFVTSVLNALIPWFEDMDWGSSPIEELMYLSGSAFRVGTHLPDFDSINYSERILLLILSFFHLFTFYFADLEVEGRTHINLKIVETGVIR